jgi:hypothetical protein
MSEEVKQKLSKKETNQKYYQSHKELFKKSSQIMKECIYCNKSFKRNYFTQHLKFNTHILNKELYELKNNPNQTLTDVKNSLLVGVDGSVSSESITLQQDDLQ